MERARSYGDGCGIALGLDLVGERWALLVVRELLLGPLRFTDLRAGLPAASPNVLSQRLRELERAGIVTRRRLPPPAAARVYALTPSGLDLGPVLTALGTWALRSGASSAGPPPAGEAPAKPAPGDGMGGRVPAAGAASGDGPGGDGSGGGRARRGRISAVSAMLTLRTYWRGGPPVGEVEVRLGERVYAVVDGQVTAGPGRAPVATVTTDPATLVGVLGGEIPVTAPGLRVEGDAGAVVALITRVRLPEGDLAPG